MTHTPLAGSSGPERTGPEDPGALAGHDLLRREAAAVGLPPQQAVLPARGLVRSGDVTLHYLEWPGPRHAPALLFLHGGGLHAYTWDLVAPALRNTARCVALDLRGHGFSGWSPTGDYRLETLAADVRALVDALGIDELVIAGHSLGGMTALHVAEGKPEMLRGLALVDVGPRIDLAAGHEVHRVITAAPPFGTLAEAYAAARGQPPGRRARAARSVAQNLKAAGRGLAWRYDPAQFTPREDQGGIDWQRQWDIVRSLHLPTLVVRGEHSRILSARAAAELCAALPDGRCHEVADAGHNVQLANPAGLADALSSFLADPGRAHPPGAHNLPGSGG